MTSLLQKKREAYQPPLPKGLQNIHLLGVKENGSFALPLKIKKLFPHLALTPFLTVGQSGKKKNTPMKVGVVFSGGQAPGGHNVIFGLLEALQKLHPRNELWGFLNGPSGILKGQTKKITSSLLKPYRNQGGFDIIGSGRTKIETKEQLKQAAKSVKKLKLDGLVIIGGDDSNTNAAILAEYFLAQKLATQVIGVPKTIDGDLQNEYVDISFGFDTASKTYAEIIGNIAKDALSAKKYYHFIRLMGRSASHITLECALQTQPNLAFISEEIEKENLSLQDLLRTLVQLIEKRAKKNKNYGIVLIPEGLIEFVPEIKKLIQELNRILAKTSVGLSEIRAKLSSSSRKVFSLFPLTLQKQLLLDRDPHGNVQVSKIETEKLFIELVKDRLKEKKASFHAVSHFLGYEGRAGFPTNFDASYCYALGHAAAILLNQGYTGCMACIRYLRKPFEDWEAIGVPLVSLFTMEERKGKRKPVIKKALVNLQGKPFKRWSSLRKMLSLEDKYLCPGPIQFFDQFEKPLILS